ncbi:MAG: hypothetical protein ACRCXD_03410 [Luteolibacter sp.]
MAGERFQRGAQGGAGACAVGGVAQAGGLMNEAKSTRKETLRRFTVRMTPRIEKILRDKLKPFLRYGFELEDVKEVYKRGVTDYVIFPRSGIDRLAFALARVTSYLTGTGTKDLDLMPPGFQARPLSR